MTTFPPPPRDFPLTVHEIARAQMIFWYREGGLLLFDGQETDWRTIAITYETVERPHPQTAVSVAGLYMEEIRRLERQLDIFRSTLGRYLTSHAETVEEAIDARQRGYRVDPAFGQKAEGKLRLLQRLADDISRQISRMENGTSDPS